MALYTLNSLLDRHFPSKILLFGEYSILEGSQALGVPFFNYYSCWDFDSYEQELTSMLREYVKFAFKINPNNWNQSLFDELSSEALFLDSNIPTGYGLGSSGSVVAAVYHLFAKNRKTAPQDLIGIFQEMEAFYHGKSSGLDPLISYLDRPIYKKGEAYFELDLKENSILSKLRLWNSKHERATKSLVNWFKEQLVLEQYKYYMHHDYISVNNRLIEAFITEDVTAFDSLFNQLANMQRVIFNPMFPDDVMLILEQLDIEEPYEVKLCGAGGGGFYLLYFPDEIHDHEDLIPVIL